MKAVTCAGEDHGRKLELAGNCKSPNRILVDLFVPAYAGNHATKLDNLASNDLVNYHVLLHSNSVRGACVYLTIPDHYIFAAGHALVLNCEYESTQNSN